MSDAMQVGLPMLTFGLVLVLWSLREPVMSWWLRTRGTTVAGDVVASKKAAEDASDGYSYTNVIEFDDTLGAHRRFKTRTRLPLKGPVEVVYDDDRPRLAQLTHADGIIAVHWLILGSITALWGIAILAGWWGPS